MNLKVSKKMVGFYEIALVVTLAVCAETNAECFDGRCVDAETAVFAMDAPGFAWFWNPVQAELLHQSGGAEGVWNTTEQPCETTERDCCVTTECCDSGCDKGSARKVNINEIDGGTQTSAFDADFEWTERSNVEDEGAWVSGGQNDTNDTWDETDQSYLDLDRFTCSMEMGAVSMRASMCACEWRNMEVNGAARSTLCWTAMDTVPNTVPNTENNIKNYEVIGANMCWAEPRGVDNLGAVCMIGDTVGEQNLSTEQIQGDLGFGESQGDYERGRVPSPARIANFDTVGEMAHTDFWDFGCEDGQ